ncbi:MAG: CARDB domain-containing protein, partial [Candidatus Thermoplasmatota archaeon]|jgi:hypothetical protein
VTVRNLGNTARTLKVAVLGDENATELSLAAFEARPLRLTHRLLAVPEAGQTMLVLAAFDGAGTLASLQLALEVHPVPIIEARWTAVEAVVDPLGQPLLRFTLEASNLGNEGVRVRPTVWGIDAEVEPAVLDLPAGDMAQVNLFARVSDPLSEQLAGMVRLLREEDPSVSLAEIDLPAVPPQPNLRLDGWTVTDDSPRAGTRVPFHFELHNTGGAASEPTIALVYIDRTLHATLPVRALEPNETITLSGSAKLPEGRHALIVLVNAQRNVVELRSDDNGASAVFDVAASTWVQRAAPGPDLGLLAMAMAAAVAAVAGRRRR